MKANSHLLAVMYVGFLLSIISKLKISGFELSIQELLSITLVSYITSLLIDSAVRHVILSIALSVLL